MTATDGMSIPFAARKVMQDAIWRECIAPGNNEWTTWTDSIALAECAARALADNGWTIAALDRAGTVERLQAIVTGLAHSNVIDGETGCVFCGQWTDNTHREACPWRQARAVSPTPTDYDDDGWETLRHDVPDTEGP